MENKNVGLHKHFEFISDLQSLPMRLNAEFLGPMLSFQMELGHNATPYPAAYCGVLFPKKYSSLKNNPNYWGVDFYFF